MRIYIMGPSGSGTTTLGKELSRRLEIPQEDSDSMFWKDSNPPYTEKRNIEELHKSFYNFTTKDTFILSGDVLNWGIPTQELLKVFTHLIYLYVPWEVRENRIRKREEQRFGERVKPSGDMYRTHEEFITWASKYEDEDQVGRNIVSQKKFIKYFSKSSKNIIKFEEDLNIEIIVNQSMKFLKV